MSNAYGGAIFGAAVNAGGGIISNVLAGEREADARAQNYMYGEKAADKADARTRALYGDLYGIKAQMKQLKEAGLSPSMFYGDIPGSTGQAGTMGTGAAGISPTTFGINPLEGANLALIQAQTNKTNAEANKIKGVDTELTTAQVAEALANAGYRNASENYTKSLTTYQNYLNYITDETKEFTINQARALSDKAATDTEKAVFELISAKNQAEYDEKTLEERIRTVKLQNENKHADTLLKRAQMDLSRADERRALEEINIWHEQLEQGWANVMINAMHAENEYERNKIIDEYYDQQIELGFKQLNFDKDKLSREMRYKWITYFTTLIAESFQNFGNNLIKILPMVKKP